ncbi:MAG: hypothetical protein ACK521_04900 [bacterium]|jgi:hypothetical protein
MDLEEQKIRMDLIQKKYDDWSRVLLEPMTVNDARLFSIESRLTEEEEMRVKEYEYIRDLMKKLIYALEQLNMVNIENKKLGPDKDSLYDNSANMLPNLINAGKDQKHAELSKTMEFMMLKRLNFLRN